MNKWLAMLIGMTLVSVSTLSQANEVQDQMMVIAKNYGTILSTNSPDEFKQGLAAMKDAATKAQQGVPDKLKGQDKDSASMKDYRHGLDVFMGEIDGAKALADAGQLDKAKEAAQQFKMTRNEYHQKYK
ncbi:cytochrome b562 [Pragia fontium]|uniref:cytochrome b562 n=1 Tax=Pragia fontium TaxID=82985 RepID=UPI00064A85E9|nr:cytochrome b562 [Pragia fontium]AKJ41410.1 cytochrome B562 [Pragia fontium]